MDWRDACKKLQEEGLKFEIDIDIGRSWNFDMWNFTAKIEDYRIAAQPIPDRADWRELCGKLQDCGIVFEMHHADLDTWSKWKNGFCFSERPIKDFRIPAQPIPAGIEKYLEEEMAEQKQPQAKENKMVKNDLYIQYLEDAMNHAKTGEPKQDKPEIPHLEQQIQWHEDKLHSLRTGEPMRVWQYKNIGGYWFDTIAPCWFSQAEYRRKPHTVTYWHCVGACTDKGGKEDTVYLMSGDLEDLEKEVIRHRKMYTTAKFSPIIETTVELED